MQTPTNNTFSTNRFTAKVSFVCLAFIAGALFLPLFAVHAQSIDYTMQSMEVGIEIHEDGGFDVQELIKVEFHEKRHGIFRIISLKYEIPGTGTARKIYVSNVRVTDFFGNALTTDLVEDDTLSIHIGNADVFVEGEQQYLISYHVEGALQSFEEFDEIFWNITGTGWQQVPGFASLVLTLPEGHTFEPSDFTAACYTGVYGSEDRDCEFSISEAGVLTASTTNNFLAIAFDWPKGIVDIPKPSISPVPIQKFSDISLRGSNLDLFALILPFIALFLMHRYWKRHGKDPKGRGTIIPQYEPPAGLRPTELGTLIDTKVHPKDLSAAIVWFAVHGYLKITEEVKERWGPDKKTYTLDRLKDAGDDMREWERKYFKAIFPGNAKSATGDQLKKRLPVKVDGIKDKILFYMVDNGFYDKDPIKAKSGWLIIGVMVLITGAWGSSYSMFIFGRPIAGIAVLVIGAIIMIYGSLMSKRTEKGVEAYEYALGFKMFLETAEKYRIKFQEKEGIFEEYLPYAMVYGVADKWAKAFKAMNLELEQPTWYKSSLAAGALDMIGFTAAMTSMASTVQSQALSPRGSGSSSYSSGGGGFSGGGFGGGGGGSW